MTVSAAATEPRNERVTLTVTRSEKDALRLVSLIDQVSESELLRERTITDIVARADVLRARTANTEG